LTTASSSLKDQQCKQTSKINVANKEVLVITKHKTTAEGTTIQQDSHATHKRAILHTTYTKKKLHPPLPAVVILSWKLMIPP